MLLFRTSFQKNEPHYMINFKHKENVTEMLWFVSIRKTVGLMLLFRTPFQKTNLIL